MAISMAPGLSNVIVYEGTNPTDILNRMATDDLSKQLSSSWDFTSEGDGDFISQFEAQFAAQGQTFFQSSGDDGAYYQGIPEWAASPYVTLVGGTVLTTGANSAWQSETAWSGSGGGVSLVNTFQIPSWQVGVGNAANQASTSLRNSPDVAMVAEDVWVIYNDGSAGAFNGTSIGAPLWAGLTALVNQQAAANGQGDVGFLNPTLYSICAGLNYSSCFHDITNGNNGNSGNPSGYNAVAGYDLCTGWGTPSSSLIDILAGLVPTVTITSPSNGSVFTDPAAFAITATASDTSATITSVQFMLNDALIGNSTIAPYSATVNSLASGIYTLSAVATDSNGLRAINSVTVFVSSTSAVLTASALVGGQFQFVASGLVPGTTNYIQASSDLSSSNNWISISTNVATTTNLTVSRLVATNLIFQFFRLVETQ